MSLQVLKNQAEQHHSSTTKPDSEIVEATLFLKGGSVIRSTEKTEDMYSSIDLISHNIAKKLKRHNNILQEKRGASKETDSNTNINESDQFDEEELLVELNEKYKVRVSKEIPRKFDVSKVKRKTFPMPAITIEEAILCLYNVDHPFYVFRNKATSEINVVYKREDGYGIGLIEPEK